LDYINTYLELFDNEYFNKNNSGKLKWQTGLVLKERVGEPVIGCRRCFENLIEIFIKVDNSEGLFLKLVQILDLSGLEVIDASISTSSNNRIAANTFITKFSHHNRALNSSELKEVRDRILNNFNSYSPFKKSSKKEKNLKSFKKVLYITNIEDELKQRNLLTIETLDSHGLLGKIAKVLNENGTSIYSARINTLGDRVEDTFEIEDINLSKVSNAKIQKITKALTELI
jgi:[protein-PII] uridylyltransferase